MNRIRHSGFWILLAIGLLDIVFFMVPITSLGIIFCLLFYPSGIGYAGRWLSNFYEEISGESASGGKNRRPEV